MQRQRGVGGEGGGGGTNLWGWTPFFISFVISIINGIFNTLSCSYALDYKLEHAIVVSAYINPGIVFNMCSAL